MAEEGSSLFCDDDKSCEKHPNETDEDGEKYVSAPIDKLGPAGRWLRHRLLSSILIGTPPLVALQRRRTPLWTKLMKLNSFFGTEDFYIPMGVFILWIVDAKLGRLLCLLMGLGFYTAGFIKDVLCLPRPANPPIVPLERASQTWGLPSHHAVLGVLVPWYIWFYSYIHFSMPQWGFAVLFGLIVYWSVSVMFSRLYLGVHSPADIVAGGIIGCVILAYWIKIDTIVDRSISFGDNVVLQAIVYSLLLLFLHPRPEPRTQSLVETVAMTAVSVGFVIGKATSTRQPSIYKAILDFDIDDVSNFTLFWVSSVRLLLGYTLVILTRMLCKIVFKNLLNNLFRVLDLECFEITKVNYDSSERMYGPSFKLPPVFDKQRKKRGKKSQPDIEDGSPKYNLLFVVNYVSYVCVGWVAISGVPLLCHSIGLVL